MPPPTDAFWRRKPLRALDATEWESLCDGCGRCCVHKVQDPDDRVHYTFVACRLLDTHQCRCGDYPNRQARVPDCVRLDSDATSLLAMMPTTCAYRLLSEGRDLPGWHPLISGDPESVHRAGISVRGKVIDEKDADLDRLEAFVIDE